MCVRLGKYSAQQRGLSAVFRSEWLKKEVILALSVDGRTLTCIGIKDLGCTNTLSLRSTKGTL
jgi:hypothetical protein